MNSLERLARAVHEARIAKGWGWINGPGEICWCPNIAVPPGTVAYHSMQDILTKRDELSGKPKEWVNDWARWRAQDRDGSWYECSHKPVLNADYHQWENGCQISMVNKGEVLGDWRDTLEARMLSVDECIDILDDESPGFRDEVDAFLKERKEMSIKDVTHRYTDEQLLKVANKLIHEQNEDLFKALSELELEQPKWNGEGLPTVEYLRSIIDYNSDTGLFIWRNRPESEFKYRHQFVAWNNRWAGSVAGCSVAKKNKVYCKISINNKRYYAHRVAWAIFYGEWPSDEIDHINGDSEDNSIINLREVSRQENCRNVLTRKDSVSGYCGVNWHSLSGKWRARVKDNGKEVYLGLFDDIEDAALAIKQKRDDLGFHQNHGRKQDVD